MSTKNARLQTIIIIIAVLILKCSHHPKVPFGMVLVHYIVYDKGIQIIMILFLLIHITKSDFIAIDVISAAVLLPSHIPSTKPSTLYDPII